MKKLSFLARSHELSQRGTVTVMTGAAGAIGHALALQLHRHGHRLCLTDLDGGVLEEVAERSGLCGKQGIFLEALDVRDADQWRSCIHSVVERHGRLDVLFNIAGYMRACSILELEDRDVEQHFDVNAKGIAYGTRAAAVQMVRQGRGHIVNLASLMGIAAVPGFSLYSASKHAARGFSLSAAQELQAHGVHVTVVCPDAVDTGMLDAQLECDAAAIAFSGPRPLHVEEVVQVLSGRVLKQKPIEVTMAPPFSARTVLSKIVAAVPGLTVPLRPLFAAIGRRGQRKARARRR